MGFGALKPILCLPPYIVVYEIDEARGEAVVLAVFHDARSGERER